MTKADLLRLADRATRLAGDAHRRGDYISCARLQATGRRYRDMAFGGVYAYGPGGPITSEEYSRKVSA